ncbi:MAG: flavodoxin domain-containing protein [Candidatus Bathyarchaeota archaeon]|nr:flavodoxin domain-containing protein [Candidatus Bathyarchaeum sp.]
MKNAAIIYWSSTGNTQKVAFAIKDGLEAAGVNVSLMKTTKAYDIDYFDYDLVCVGCPSIQWHPPKPVTEFLLKKFDDYKKQEKIKTGAPKVPGKNALIFCTYSGPHTGLREATPVGKYVGQFFEHIGFTVVDEWYVLSEFIGSEERSTKGRMGDIRGKPTKEELQKIMMDAKNLASKL